MRTRLVSSLSPFVHDHPHVVRDLRVRLFRVRGIWRHARTTPALNADARVGFFTMVMLTLAGVYLVYLSLYLAPL
jgi:hypothetical protein